jgi:hypothetical protein
VDYGDNLSKCVDAIEAMFPTITVDVSGSSSASCEGNSCTAQAEGKASASCAISRVGTLNGSTGAGLLLAGFGLLCCARRRKH